MQLVISRTILMGGDFNCTVELDGRTGSNSAGIDVTSRLLVEMTVEASLRDVIGSMGPNARNYSWSRPDGSVRSRIDFLFTSPTVKPGQSSMVAVHFSDHRAIADSLSLVRDTIEYVKSRKDLTALVSLDQEKAFDRVSHEFMDQTLRALGLGDFFCDVVTAMYRDTSSTALVNGWKTDPFPVLSGVRQGCPLSPLLFICVIELLAEHIRQNRDIKGVTGRKQREGRSKVVPLMDDVSVFSADGRPIKELGKTCIKFGKASGAKINIAKSETLLLGHWTPTRDPLPFAIKQDFLNILGFWFCGESAVEKSWEERLARTKQKLGLWSLRKLMIEGKSLVKQNKTLPVLHYIAQVWPVQPRTAKAITRMIFYLIWNFIMDRVKRGVTFKTHDKGGKGVTDIATILRGSFICHCVRNTLRLEDESHVGFLMARFFLLQTWRRLGWAEWESTVPTTGKPHGFIKKWRSSLRSTVWWLPPDAVDSKDRPMTDLCEGRQRANWCPPLCHSGPHLGKHSLQAPDQPPQRHCVDGHPGRPASESLHACKKAQPIQVLPKRMHRR
ncbi:hypothetical protein NDU88_001183 [Pleurodeles waltl]|uniref:Reverse transcriptase domain-containing protein n=1 Tax=Pleurodeles waltl TaxID=8319 RepID=A0AAV7SZA4_PLEWA|nr:hypothetical protein NDU88_001183 [Pleurodeles waltl]